MFKKIWLLLVLVLMVACSSPTPVPISATPTLHVIFPTLTPISTSPVVPAETSVSLVVFENCDITATLSKAKETQSTGLIFGPACTIKVDFKVSGITIMGNGTQGEGFYESSFGVGKGTGVSKTYLNVNKSNGVYSGKNKVVCHMAGDAPDVECGFISYNLTLTD